MPARPGNPMRTLCVSAPVSICAKITDLNLPLPGGRCTCERRDSGDGVPLSEVVGARLGRPLSQ
jgi:hypothetical protein